MQTRRRRQRWRPPRAPAARCEPCEKGAWHLTPAQKCGLLESVAASCMGPAASPGAAQRLRM
eukprot:360264-Chlamydomonas_euryale.AAC.3